MFGAFSAITVRGLPYIQARRFITITRVYYCILVSATVLTFSAGAALIWGPAMLSL